MKSILSIGINIVKELRRTGEPELLIELFNQRTADWKYSQLCNEGCITNVFSDVCNFGIVE